MKTFHTSTCRLLTSPLTGFVAASAPLVVHPAQSLEQSGVLGLQLLNDALSGAFIHHCPVLDTLCSKVKGCSDEMKINTDNEVKDKPKCLKVRQKRWKMNDSYKTLKSEECG